MKIKELLKAFWSWLKAEIAADISDAIDIDGDKPEHGTEGGILDGDDEPQKVDADGFDYASLKWVYGGFHGENTERVDGVKIVLDSVDENGLRYHFEKGDLTALSPANTHDNPDCIACLFCKVGNEWRGGKFDWISSDRITRDFANIKNGYNGWKSMDVAVAEAYAFVIVSKDGKKRTNVSVIS